MTAEVHTALGGSATDRVALAEALARAVYAVPGVSALIAPWPGAATEFADRRVEGVTLHPDLVEVFIRVNALPVPPVADRAAEAATQVLVQANDPRPVRISIEDLDDSALSLPAREGITDARR